MTPLRCHTLHVRSQFKQSITIKVGLTMVQVGHVHRA